MESRLTIKNFRIFDENGATIEFKPITILTGANSSGKSSAVKAVFLLNSFLSQIKKDVVRGKRIELDGYKLDFTTFPNNLLGNFNKILHDGSKSRGITIEYSVYSHLLSKDVDVQLVFSADNNDTLNNAFLQRISFRTEEGVFYEAERGGDSFCNINILKNDCIDFLKIDLLAFYYYYFRAEENMSKSTIKKDEWVEKAKQIEESLNHYDKKRVEDILRYIRIGDVQFSFREMDKSAYPSYEQLEHIKSTNSLFDIPVLKELASVLKPDFKEYVVSTFLKRADRPYSFASKKVINAFLDSEYDCFEDYFKALEHDFINRIICNDSRYISAPKLMCLPDADELMLSQDYIISYPKADMGKVFHDIHANLDLKKRINQWETKALTFEMLYEVVMAWNKKKYPRNDYYEYDGDQLFGGPFVTVYHHSYLLIAKFVEALCKEVIIPDWCGNMSYVSSSRVDVKRLYTLENKDDFTSLLQNYFEKKRNYLDNQKRMNQYIQYPGKRDYVIDSFINRWIERFEIGKAISLHTDDEGLGVQIRLHRNNEDYGRLLADEGYGITQLVSILLQIETAIISAQGEKNNGFFGMDSLDHYDSNQFHYETNSIAIEEPEIHLHPKFQSLLAEMFLDAYKNFNIHFIIETHSEYLIRKFQGIIARHELNADSLSTLYVNDPNLLEDEPHIKNIGIRKDGRLSSSFGPGFFDEADNLSDEIFEAQTQS